MQGKKKLYFCKQIRFLRIARFLLKLMNFLEDKKFGIIPVECVFDMFVEERLFLGTWWGLVK